MESIKITSVPIVQKTRLECTVKNVTLDFGTRALRIHLCKIRIVILSVSLVFVTEKQLTVIKTMELV